MVKTLADRAFAKINLFLRVTGRRADGYHELDSIFVPVSIADSVRIEVRPGRESAVALRCDLALLADPERNLAVRAARAFMTEFGVAGEVRIDLEKKIPVGAGLGGGSSDAGAVLRMMAALYRVNDSKRLAGTALRLGADVPFFLDPRPARVGGIGERLLALQAFPKLNLVIAVPPVEVSTAAIYKGLTREAYSGPAPEDDISSILRGEILSRHLVNDLAPVAMQNHPQIARLVSLLEQSGARAASMSGSGGAVFGVFSTGDEAARAVESVRGQATHARVFSVVSLPDLKALGQGSEAH